ncbi:MAG: selenocysteine-specific elongation factor [Acidobacteriota bacterium]|nr:selenocysteine-specific elongation factor [Acidobacteriota bacterium]
MRSVIVGTAGHIDHGKTSLVRALTGVDADRLPEEKRRGITIDLGFAELDMGDVRVGFVDVPGHERFVKNMLAGAHGIDSVALVVAADEGVMPQTREHFEIARLLDVRSGLVVITKIDAVEAEMIELVRSEIEELAAGSFLEGAPVVAVSSRTGEGLDELKRTLREMALRAPARSSESVARLPVDRSFTMRGFGAVATGTLVAGEIVEGEELDLLPTDVRARVRGIQVHGRATKRAEAGQRTAVNLAGVEASQVARGMTLAPAGRLRPTQVIDVLLEVLASAPRPLRSRARVRVHIGAAEVLARVQTLEDAGEIAVGARGFAQLRLESPIVALPGERFIIRSYSPQRTIAGGVVLDAFAVRQRGRERRVARARLSALATSDGAGRLTLFVANAGERGLTRADLAARTGWRDEVLDEALGEAKQGGSLVEAEGIFLAREIFDRFIAASVAQVEAHHGREPLQRGLARETLRERVFARVAPEVFRTALTEAERVGLLVAERDVVRAASYSLELSTEDEQLREWLEQVYRDAALELPTLDEAFARVSEGRRINREHARKILQLLIESGALARVAADLFVHRDALESLVVALRDHAATRAADRLIDVATFKEIAGVSRKYAIPLLEYLDRERITRRAGDQRVVL